MKELELCYLYVFFKIFLDYDKIIDIYASKYPRKMLLINSLVKSKLLKLFTLEKHIKPIQTSAFLFYILSLYSVKVFVLLQLTNVDTTTNKKVYLCRVHY